MKDYTKYIGIPFEYGGRDTKSLDCYGLYMLLSKELDGKEVPDVTSPETLELIADLISTHKPKWKPCDIEEGALILFTIMGYGAHVGYVIDRDRMIHTWEKTSGVTIERISLSWKHRILGCYKYED